jgi:glyoxylase-like metal-dependent hydrolase (beta-lactamase superfamily II)
MMTLELDGWTVLSLTDATPPPVAWTSAFPHDAPATNDAALSQEAPDRMFHTRFTVLALRRGDRVALVDAGIGPGPSAYFGGLEGGLDRALADHGISPEQVSCVAFTHFHLDHVGWASHDGSAWFPNARYVAPATELAHWAEACSAAALPHHVEAFERHVSPLIAQGRIVAADDGGSPEGWPELAYRAVHGHTVGHCALVLSARRPLLIAGDAWHSPVQIQRPDWCHRADRNRPAAIRSRSALADWALASDAVIAAGHFPPGREFGRILRTAGGQNRFEAIEGPEG